MGDLIKLSDVKEAKENKLKSELLREDRKASDLETKLNGFFEFIGKGKNLATPDSGNEGDFSLFALSFQLIQLRGRTNELLKLIKESIEVDWSDFDPSA